MIGLLRQLAQGRNALTDVAAGPDVMGRAAIGGHKGADDLFNEKQFTAFFSIDEAARKLFAVRPGRPEKRG